MITVQKYSLLLLFIVSFFNFEPRPAQAGFLMFPGSSLHYYYLTFKLKF